MAACPNWFMPRAKLRSPAWRRRPRLSDRAAIRRHEIAVQIGLRCVRVLEENEHIEVGERGRARFAVLRHDPFDENNSSVRSEGAGTVGKDFDALLVIPVVNNGFEDVKVGFGHVLEEVARDDPTARRSPRRASAASARGTTSARSRIVPKRSVRLKQRSNDLPEAPPISTAWVTPEVSSACATSPANASE